MNERIKELAEQANEAFYQRMGKGAVRGTFYFDGFAEKFAELIVKEMLETCEDHPAWTGRMLGEQIKQHFGIKPRPTPVVVADSETWSEP